MPRSVVEKESYGSVTIFWLNRDEALRRLEAAAQALVESRPDVIAVYLFGSLAEGRAVPGSDADVLILLRESAQRWIDRPLEFSSYFSDCGLSVELFCYTEEEAAQLRFARDALGRSVLLAARPGRRDAPRV